MSQYRVTYQHRDRELTRDVVAFSPEEAERVFKHAFRGIAPSSIQRIEHAPAKPGKRPPPFRPARHRASDAELRQIAAGLRELRERLASSRKA